MILVCFPVTTDWGGGGEWFREEKLTECLWIELFLLDFPTSKLLAPKFSPTAPQTFSKRPPSFYNSQLFNPSGISKRYSGEDSSEERNGSVIPEEGAVAAYKSGFLWKYQCNKWHTDLNFLYFLWCLTFLLKWLITFVVDLKRKER